MPRGRVPQIKMVCLLQPWSVSGVPAFPVVPGGGETSSGSLCTSAGASHLCVSDQPQRLEDRPLWRSAAQHRQIQPHARQGLGSDSFGPLRFWGGVILFFVFVCPDSFPKNFAPSLLRCHSSKLSVHAIACDSSPKVLCCSVSPNKQPVSYGRL